jgi:hypothetical protein
MHTRSAFVAVALVFAACTSFRVSGSHVPAPGHYEYTGQFHRTSTTSSRPFFGSLLITEATRERIVGRWEVSEYQPDLHVSSYASGAYVVNADVSGLGSGRPWGTFEHHISRVGAATNLRCTGMFLNRVGANTESYPATCTLTYRGR